MKLVKEIFSGSKSLITGMSLTLREFFKPTITCHYPHQTLPIPKRYRGHIELTWEKESGKANCIACNMCSKACPSDCITVDGVKLEGEKKKSVSNYVLDFTKCSLCGACIEACPVEIPSDNPNEPGKAIQFTQRYNLASTTNSYLAMDLVQRYKDQAAKK